MSDFNTDPRNIDYLVIDSEKDDCDRLGMRASWGRTDLYDQGRDTQMQGVGTNGILPITGHRVRTFIDAEARIMTTYYFDHLFQQWRKTIYHFPIGTTFAKAGAITYNSNSSWRSYKSFHRYPQPNVTVITV